MIECKEMIKLLNNGAYTQRLKTVYCTDDTHVATERIEKAIHGFLTTFDKDESCEIGIFSGPGRTEIGGNHTDHQHGCVLAASVNLDTLCCASLNNENKIRLQSEGYPMVEVDLNDLTVNREEFGKSSALVRGVASRIKDLGYEVHGFDAYAVSNVLSGSGLSSSAAYEVMVGTVLNHLFCNDELSDIQIAQIGQFAENIFFGKPCGLMDQMASSVGSAVSIDFADTEHPIVTKITYDFTKSGYSLCIIDSGADHADLTDEYAAIPEEMCAIASYFSKRVLREVNEEEFYNAIPVLRIKFGDRAVLRAHHFFTENKRALQEAKALDENNFEEFLNILIASGTSSYEYLQNISVTGRPKEQAVAVTLMAAEHLLNGKGAVRVHGGGFAGTIQAFVPNDMVEEFKHGIDAMIGEGKCHVLSIRPVGGITLIA